MCLSNHLPVHTFQGFTPSRLLVPRTPEHHGSIRCRPSGQRFTFCHATVFLHFFNLYRRDTSLRVLLTPSRRSHNILLQNLGRRTPLHWIPNPRSLSRRLPQPSLHPVHRLTLHGAHPRVLVSNRLYPKPPSSQIPSLCRPLICPTLARMGNQHPLEKSSNRLLQSIRSR